MEKRLYRRLDKTPSWFDRDTAQPFPLIPDPPHDAEFGEPFIEEKAFYQARYQGLEWLRDHPEQAEFATTLWRVHDGATHDVVWCMQRYQILDLGRTLDDDLCFVQVSLDQVYRWFEKRNLAFPQVLLDDLEREDCRKRNAPAVRGARDRSRAEATHGRRWSATPRDFGRCPRRTCQGTRVASLVS